jgi:chorismate mutase
MIRPEIKKIRIKLDRLDSKLLLIIKSRTNLVKQIVKLKKYKNEIVDKKRIDLILKRIKEKSIKIKLFTVRWKFFFNKNFMFSCNWIIFIDS